MWSLSSPGYWKLIALGSLAGCGVLLWRTPAAVATQSEARCAIVEQDSASSWLDPVGAAHGERLADELTPMLAELEHATGIRARCKALGRVARRAAGDTDALQRVLAYSERNQPAELRVCSTAALGQASSSVVLPWLLELLEERASDVAEAAARALAQRNDPESRAALLDVANSAEPALRVTASIALAEVGAAESGPLIAALLESGNLRDRDRLITALGTGAVPGALPLLEKLARSGTGSAHYTAIQALGELGGPGAARSLLQLLHDRPSLAPMVAQALARTRDESARKGLLQLAVDGQSRNTSMAAMQALVGFDDPDVHGLMARALSGTDIQKTNMAMEYFANHPDQRATAQLIEIARRGSPHTGYAALHALARSDDDGARSLIEELAHGRGPMKAAALMSLAALPEGAEEARQIALDQVREGGPQLGQAIELLANDDSPEAHAALLAVARRNDPHSSPQVMSWLGQRGDAESRRTLEQIASGPGNSETRGMAMYALAQSGDQAASQTLLRVLQTGDATARAQAVGALSQVAGPDVEHALLTASRDKDSQVALQAASALGQIASPAALTRLEELARGSDLQVTRHALMSLGSSSERVGPIAQSLSASRDPSARLLAVEVVHGLPEGTAAGIILSGVRDQDANVVRAALGNFVFAGNDEASTRSALQAVVQRGELPDDVREQARQLLRGREPVEVDEE